MIRSELPRGRLTGMFRPVSVLDYDVFDYCIDAGATIRAVSLARHILIKVELDSEYFVTPPDVDTQLTIQMKSPDIYRLRRIVARDTLTELTLDQNECKCITRTEQLMYRYSLADDTPPPAPNTSFDTPLATFKIEREAFYTVTGLIYINNSEVIIDFSDETGHCQIRAGDCDSPDSVVMPSSKLDIVNLSGSWDDTDSTPRFQCDDIRNIVRVIPRNTTVQLSVNNAGDLRIQYPLVDGTGTVTVVLLPQLV